MQVTQPACWPVQAPTNTFHRANFVLADVSASREKVTAVQQQRIAAQHAYNSNAGFRKAVKAKAGRR
jgi:hypothetical protein